MYIDSSVCNNKQRWNKGKCRCECKKELSDKRRCVKGFIWNPSACNCKCDKSCDIGQYLDWKNCKCRNKIIGELVEECTENIYENEMIYNGTLNAIMLNTKTCTFWTILFIVLCIALFVMFIIISICISRVFICFYWYIKKITFLLSLILSIKQKFIEWNCIEYI